jgi:hypothetical protein
MATFEKQVAKTILEGLNSANECINTFSHFQDGNDHQRTAYLCWLQQRNTFEKLAISLFNIKLVSQIEQELQEIVGD